VSIRPCPNCRAQVARLLEEASRYAIVCYYRCESCGHVWTVDRQTGEIAHVTPLGADETTGDETPPEWYPSAHWLQSEVRSGLNLAQLARAHPFDPARARVRAQVERIRQTVRSCLLSTTLSVDDARELLADFHRLHEAIQDLETDESLTK
jgi:hypothetical protein